MTLVTDVIEASVIVSESSFYTFISLNTKV